MLINAHQQPKQNNQLYIHLISSQCKQQLIQSNNANALSLSLCVYALTQSQRGLHKH